MLKTVGGNLILLLIAAKLASQGVSAAPLPGWSIPKIGGISKPGATPPKTTNSKGEPISFTDWDSVLDQPIATSKTTSETAGKAARGAAVGAGAAAVVGGGIEAGIVAGQSPELGYDYAD